MTRTFAALAGMAGLLAWPAAGWDEPTLPAVDLKFQVDSFRLGKEPVSVERVLVRKGVAYVFPSDSKEVIVVDVPGRRVELVDVGRKVQAEITFGALDESLEKVKGRLRGAAEALEKKGGRANLLEAKMTRDLFETRLDVAEGPGPHHLRLTNPAVEVDALGEPSDDATRSTIGATLAAIAKLGAYRAPGDLPPFAELEAIAALTGDRKLRPTELIYLYRLAGPPRKFRRAYKLAWAATDRDAEALDRVDKLRESLPSLRYERYRADR